jgi:hypothetical protein
VDEVHPMGGYNKKTTLDYDLGCHFQLKWSKMAIVVVVTHDYHF